MPIDIVRDTAVSILLRVFTDSVPISDAVDRGLRRKHDRLSPRGRRFLTQLVYGTTRHALLADHVLAPLLHQPLDKLPVPIRVILRMGVFQALFLRSVTFPAMVHTSVDLAKKHGHTGTSRLVNAVLKRVPSSIDNVSLPDSASSSAEYLSVRYSLPMWIVSRWIKEHGNEGATALCAVSNEEAPRTIRVNALRTTRDELMERLVKSEILTQPHPIIPDLVEISDGPLPMDTKAFREGLFYVQDGASMLPPYLADPQRGERIADLCAAPGGKSTHFAALTANESLVVACDLDPRRMRRTRGSFDYVLLDAPCTGLGTVRRRPDLKWRLQPEAPSRLAALQRELLRSAIGLCKNGGRIVYSVCTFTPEETFGVLESIKGDGAVAFEDGPPWMDSWKISPGQYRVLPSAGDLDGYFLARLRKRR